MTSSTNNVIDLTASWRFTKGYIHLHTYPGSTGGDVLYVFEVTDDEADEVGAHLDRPLELGGHQTLPVRRRNRLQAQSGHWSVDRICPLIAGIFRLLLNNKK